MVAKKNMNSIYILYFVIFFLAVSLLIVGTLLYYARNNSNSNKNVKVDRCPVCPSCPVCPACPKVDSSSSSSSSSNNSNSNSSIPVYPKELPTYDNNREYQQVGILTSNDDNDPIILPLFSKRANNHRDRWNYYTTTDKNTMLRLPISRDNMKCDDDIGCNEIYDGNTIYIEMYKGKTFTATIYKKQTLSYFADRY